MSSSFFGGEGGGWLGATCPSDTCDHPNRTMLRCLKAPTFVSMTYGPNRWLAHMLVTQRQVPLRHRSCVLEEYITLFNTNVSSRTLFHLGVVPDPPSSKQPLHMSNCHVGCLFIQKTNSIVYPCRCGQERDVSTCVLRALLR